MGCGLLRPDLVGFRSGSLEIVSRLVEGASWGVMVEVACLRCGAIFMHRYHNMRRRPQTKACPSCSKREAVIVPRWLYARCQGQKDRCENPRNPAYAGYGGRGIRFNFRSANEASRWVLETLGLPPDRCYQLDRIDNDGHYEPGNLRWANQVANMNNTRKAGARDAFMSFRKRFPDVMYADATLEKLIRAGMSDEEIVSRWTAPSFKPKGKYGTFTMQGHYRGSPRTIS